MRRVTLFFKRLGFFQGALYVLFLLYMAWAYSQLWTIPGGPAFVLSVLAVGIGVGTALAPWMYRHYPLAHKIVSTSGWVVMLALIAIFRVPIPLPPLGYWLLHSVVWLQVTSNFWIGTYEPRIVLPDGRDLLRMLEDQENMDQTEEAGDASTATSRRQPADRDEDDANWYRKP